MCGQAASSRPTTMQTGTTVPHYNVTPCSRPLAGMICKGYDSTEQYCVTDYTRPMARGMSCTTRTIISYC
jgi:hypothetical protein